MTFILTVNENRHYSRRDPVTILKAFVRVLILRLTELPAKMELLQTEDRRQTTENRRQKT
jgi:hypothetical protein